MPTLGEMTVPPIFENKNIRAKFKFFSSDKINNS